MDGNNSMFIQISTNNICQLQCDWCVRDKGNPECMTYDTFKRIVGDFVNTFGDITLLDMTPIIGELSLTPDWLQMLDYLNNNSRVLKFDFVTNFLNFDGDIIRKLLKLHNKLSIVVSVYGHDNDSYTKNTNCNEWDNFLKSMSNLQMCLTDNNYESFPITFYFRDLSYDSIPDGKFLKLLKTIKLTSKSNVTFDSSMAGKNHNWAEQVDGVRDVIDFKVGDGRCLHSILQNCILPNGDITLCGMNDIYGKMIIGNMFSESLKDIYNSSKYVQYTKQLPELCKKCSEYESLSAEKEDVKLHENQLNKNR